MESLQFTTEAIAGMIVQGLLMMLLPVILMIVWKKKTHEKILVPVLVGAATWFLFAILLKLAPAYFLLQADNALAKTISGNVWLTYLVAGLLAGIFEETGRFLAFKFVLKNRRGRRTAVSYGVGHGGFESLYVGFQTLSLAFIGILFHLGLGSLIANGMSEAETALLIEQLEPYANLAFGECQLGVFERLPAIAAHLSFSVLVFAAVKEKRRFYLYPLAILLHALFDFSIVLYGAGLIPAWGLELLFAAFAALLALFAWRIYRNMEQKRLLLASDIHLCHLDWNGMENARRVQKFIDDIKAEYEREPFEALLLLGDYSLDHWKWQIKGSYLTQGVSNTKRFVDEYLSQLKTLPIEIRMIAGNHEQYGDALYFELTGHHREEIYVTGDWLFLLMDTYKGGLDPTEHHDGVYTGADLDFVKAQMEAYPDKKVVICSHYLEPWKESDEFKEILRDERVVCLFCGHNHRSDVWHLEEDCGNKIEACDGNYGEATGNCLWGFREVILTDHSLESSYITPANTLKIGDKIVNHHYTKSDSFRVEIGK